MPQSRSTLAPMEDPPPRTCFVGVASVARTDLLWDPLNLSRDHFLSVRIETSAQGCRADRSGKPLRRTSIRQ